MTTSRRFAITQFLSDEEFAIEDFDSKICQNLQEIFSTMDLNFMIAGLETCPTTGKKHLQMYVETNTRRRFSFLTSKMEPFFTIPCHVEKAKGTADQNVVYCSKEKVLLKIGEPMRQGSRSDLAGLKEAIDNGADDASLWENYFSLMVQYGRRLADYRDLHTAKRREFGRLFIFWGTTGTGKTRKAFELAEGGEPYVHMGTTTFFEGYANQEVAIFDEFDGTSISFAYFKQLTDRYPMRVNVKGGSKEWNPKIIVFTSNVDPRKWWPQENKPDKWWDQVQRRINESNGRIEHFDRPFG